MKISLKWAAIAEGIVLFVALIILRAFVFPFLTGEHMIHVSIATHVLMIGVVITLFSAFALTLKRAWKKYGKYMLLPIIFNVFGILVQFIAYEVDF